MVGSITKNHDEEQGTTTPQQPPEFNKGEELQGKLDHNEELEQLLHTILPHDDQLIEEGLLLSESISQGLKSFSPDLLMQQLVNNYQQAKQLYGERLIRALTGYDPSYVERNLRIPEFQRNIAENIEQHLNALKKKKLLDHEGALTELGLTIASIALVADELDQLKQKGLLGERSRRTRNTAGMKADTIPYRHQPYKDLHVQASVKKAVRRGHTTFHKDDFVAHQREEQERATIIFAIDASGSMKGKKIANAKRAGIALAYKATKKNDLVGIFTFGKRLLETCPPTKNFSALLKTIMDAHAANETNIAVAIKEATKLFQEHPIRRTIKHLVILTDGLNTASTDKEVISATINAQRQGITTSIIGLSLDQKGTALSQKIVETGKGTLYLATPNDQLDTIIIEAYERINHQ